ncbi:Hypothetical protein FKW44_004517 [Caligus rogercresseyi]|uniref:Uncharacterized protein n=1 Tax=Caligus rogercresseyi TaxID=217165 RepID=A0A7T8K9Y9_CALRO|nr:Hypothetical protein FKW44_004517 [Caligus rogercresseyi]
MATWKAVNLPNSTLSDVLYTSDSRTRSGKSDLRRSNFMGCTYAVNMAKIWNSSS